MATRVIHSRGLLNRLFHCPRIYNIALKANLWYLNRDNAFVSPLQMTNSADPFGIALEGYPKHSILDTLLKVEKFHWKNLCFLR
jgi:hypothetical protein